MPSLKDMTEDELAEVKAKLSVVKPWPSGALPFSRIGTGEASPPSWIVKGLLEVGALALLFGDPGAGKSLLALDLAACIATGEAFHGHSVKKRGAVAYVAGEGFTGIRRRLLAWSIARGPNLEAAPLYVSRAPTALCEAEAMRELEASLEAIDEEAGPPVLVVIDTYSRNLGGDENASRDGAIAIQALDAIRARWGCAVLIVHHAGHGDKLRGRGWSGLRAAVDAEYRAEKVGEVMHLESTKKKDGLPPEPMAFRLAEQGIGLRDDDDLPVTSAVLERIEYSARKAAPRMRTDPTGRNQKEALAILRGLVRDGGGSSPIRGWKKACGEAGIDDRRFPEVKRALEACGLIVCIEHEVRLAE
jgi:hypothetical protein